MLIGEITSNDSGVRSKVASSHLVPSLPSRRERMFSAAAALAGTAWGALFYQGENVCWPGSGGRQCRY